MIKYLTTIFCVFLYCTSFSQSDVDNSDYASFVIIYMESKDIKPSIPTTLPEGIDAQRFKEIFHQSLNEDRQVATEKEKSAIKEWKSKYRDLDNLEVGLRDLCEDNNMTVESYRSILSQYKKDLAFRNGLKPYFRNYIKGLR